LLTGAGTRSASSRWQAETPLEQAPQALPGGMIQIANNMHAW